MTTQRKYSLPNCTLIVEGLSDGNAAIQSEVRPVISMLINAECHLTAAKEPLIGGRDFFVSLVNVVSAYAQEFLSKVPHPEAHDPHAGLVQLHSIDNNRHRLIVRQSTQNGVSPAVAPITIDLTTVQLFDLVEAVDQFLADSQTLPNLSLQIAPVAKRRTGSSDLAKQATPAAVGISSLALAAIAFFLVPIPEVQRPTQPQPQSTSNTRLATASKMPVPDIAVLNRVTNQIATPQKTHSAINRDLVYPVGVTGSDRPAHLNARAIITTNTAIKQPRLPLLPKALVASGVTSSAIGLN